MRPSSHIFVVGHHNDRSAVVFIQIFEDFHHLIAHYGIKIARRFIREDNARITHHRPCDGHPLPLAPGELRGVVFHAVGKPHFCQSLRGQTPTFSSSNIAVQQWQFHIVQYRQVIDQVVTLENKTQFLVAEFGQFIVRKSLYGFRINTDIAIGRQIQ